jgi:hypothetical protein
MRCFLFLFFSLLSLSLPLFFLFFFNPSSQQIPRIRYLLDDRYISHRVRRDISSALVNQTVRRMIQIASDKPGRAISKRSEPKRVGLEAEAIPDR